MYPLWLIKTRLQAQRGQQEYLGVMDAFKKIVRFEGLRGATMPTCIRSHTRSEPTAGLWRGFSVTAVGFIPAQLAYNFVYEWTRAHLPPELARRDGTRPVRCRSPSPFRPERVKRNFYGGAAASFASSLVNGTKSSRSDRLTRAPQCRSTW